jgi:multiple sugar transport system permease protein
MRPARTVVPDSGPASVDAGRAGSRARSRLIARVAGSSAVTILLAAVVWLFVDVEPASKVAVIALLAVGFYGYWLARTNEATVRYMLLVPSMMIMGLVTLAPLVYLIYISFHRVTMLNFNREWPFVGTTNYVRLLFEDPLFVPTLVRSLQLLVFALLLQFVIGLMLALLCNRDFRARPLVATILLLPIMTNTIVVGLLWKYMLDYQTGLINLLLSFVGVDPQPWLTNQPLPWIASMPWIGRWLVEHLNANFGFFAIIWTNTWQWTPFVFLVLMAGLRSLPQEPFEAATVDGATQWQTLWYVTLPLLKPVIGVVLLIRAVDLMKSFGLIWTLFGNAPFTRILNIHIHTLGLASQNYSMAAALSMVVGILSLLVYLFFRVFFLSDRTVD